MRFTKKDRYGHFYTNEANCRNVHSLDGKKLEGEFYENQTLAIDGNAIEKLGQLEDLAEQIGCPLDFVTTPYKLSGLKKVWYHDQWCEVVRIVVYEEATKPYMEVRCKNYKYLKMILLEEYGKTWFLTKKESQA